MLLSEKITFSETKYKKLLEEFFNRIFNISFLPSHGIDHHRRIWHYAKEILNHIDLQGFDIDQSLTDKLIISCFLHDSGMAVDSGFRHGAEGRKICERFLADNRLSVIEYSDVLEAIEYHDNKEYNGINKPQDLLTILSVADDLDALGFIGIYRYIEIYIERKIPFEELGSLITENCATRFNHFLRTYSDSSLVEKHSKRYKTINTFFDNYNQQVPFYNFNNQLTAGYCGVAETISTLINSKKSISAYNSDSYDSPDPVIQWFLGELQHELSDFS
jgi:HD superfamily phosphodiesterase